MGPAGPSGATGPAGPAGPAGASSVTFAFAPPSGVRLAEDGTFVKVASKTLPAGSWAVVATVNTNAFNGTFGPARDQIADTNCELRNGANVIGGATDRRVIPESDTAKRSLTMNGGAVTASGGEISVWCSSQLGLNETVYQAQIMMVQVGGFF